MYSQNSFLSLQSNTVNDDLIFNLFPNPASDEIKIEISNFNSQDENRLTIIDLEGRIVYNDLITTNISAISLKSLSPGVYICNVAGKNSSTTKKLVKL